MEALRLRMSFAAAFALLSLLTAFVLPSPVAAQGPAPSPSSDGVAVDQGIACLLMLVALVLTYIIH
ncbi:hypothetical protein ACJRO7_016168 [Eucalyptus globulus]|uniref:Uncharacterized protein n=1 Tax=Eucalyptus globulus TaxID=34317 RepID=A0ABD3L6Y5_EUCGL